MKNYISVILFLPFAVASCKKLNEKELKSEPLSRANSPAAIVNGLVADQSFIDLAYHSINNWSAAQYINTMLAGEGIRFIKGLQNCNGSTPCIDAAISSFGLSGDLLDDYFYSAMASAAIFHAEHPEFKTLSATQRQSLFREALVAGMYSTDPRWQPLRDKNVEISNSLYKIVQHKKAPDVTDYIDCFMSEIGAIWSGAMSLGAVVEAIKTGNVAKGLKAAKTFLKSTVGRTLSWVGLAIMAWDIFKCCYDLSNSDGDGLAVLPHRQKAGLSPLVMPEYLISRRQPLNGIFIYI